MAKSAARKKIQHRLRQDPHAYDPRKTRGSWGNVKPILRIKPNRKKDVVIIDD